MSMASLSLVATIFLFVTHVGIARSDTLVGRSNAETVSRAHDGGGADSAACKPARQARALLQHVASGTGTVVSDEQPDGIRQYTSEYIKNELLKQAEATTKELQAEVETAAQSFEACSGSLASMEESLSSQESTLITAEQRHNECEMKVNQMNRSEEAICGDLNQFALNLEAPDGAKEVNGTDPEGCIASLAAMSEFYTIFYPQFMEKKQACEVAQNGEDVTVETCNADKKSIEESWCSLKDARVQTCKTMDSCFDEKAKRFDTSLEYTKLLEENTKEHVQKHIDSCNARDDCDPGTIDLSRLVVNYPVKPPKMECDSTVKTDWNYTKVVCPGDV